MNYNGPLLCMIVICAVWVKLQNSLPLDFAPMSHNF